MDPITVLSAFIPLLVQGGKAAINKFFGQEGVFKPANVEDYVKIKDKELELFSAINQAGGNNPSYLWVEAIIRLQRPLVVALVLMTWAFGHYLGWENTSAVDNAASVVTFYLFGERSMLHWNDSTRKKVDGN